MNSKAFIGGSIAATLLLCGGTGYAANTQPRADNTAANASDRNADAATPVDQSNTADAIEVTANIRKAVLGDKTLSSSAHNVKIITSGNTVTLRGPVVSTAEKDRVNALARQYAAGKVVLDQLTVNGA